MGCGGAFSSYSLAPSHARTQHARTGEAGRLRQFTALQSQAAAAAPTTRNRQAMASGLPGFTALFVCLFWCAWASGAGRTGLVEPVRTGHWAEAGGRGPRGDRGHARALEKGQGETGSLWPAVLAAPAVLPNLYYKTGSTYLHNEPVSLEDLDC